MKTVKNIIKLSILLLLAGGCSKDLQISPNIGTLTSTQVFATTDQANSAMNGVYFQMINLASTYSSYLMTVDGGLSADELNAFNISTQQYYPFQINTLTATNSYVYNGFWGAAYSIIYLANSVINGVQNSTGLTDSVKHQLIAQAELVRALNNFYLTNLFGDVPLVNSTNWRNTSLLSRTAQAAIYQAIIADLKDAQSILPSDYSAGNQQRIVPNKWAATALLARVYLYTKDWQDAITQSTMLINNTSLYSLLSDLTQVFLANSMEAIWQLQQDNKGNTFNAVPEADLIIPYDNNSRPVVYLTNQLLNAFEPGDNRKSAWIDSTTYGGITYYYPFKYKIGIADEVYNGPMAEYYMVLRYAEQFLIRSEAKAQLGSDLAGAQADLNTIRVRAGLDSLKLNDRTTLLAAIAHERQIEFFAEWGHRWLDLKRTGTATAILSPIKSKWTPNAQLFPIPAQEIITDPNLIQNPGY